MDSKQIFEAKFQNADVLKATGVSLGTLQTWLNRGLIKPSSDLTPGTGSGGCIPRRTCCEWRSWLNWLGSD